MDIPINVIGGPSVGFGRGLRRDYGMEDTRRVPRSLLSGKVTSERVKHKGLERECIALSIPLPSKGLHRADGSRILRATLSPVTQEC